MPISSNTSLAIFEERFIGLFVPTKEADFPRLGDAGDIIAFPEKESGRQCRTRGGGNLTHYRGGLTRETT